jgi:hypothetical protein
VIEVMLMLRCHGVPVWGLFLVLFSAAPVRAIVAQPFTAGGTYVRPAGDPPSFQIGSGGFVEEIAAFLVGGPDLALSFSSTLSPDATDLVLRYDVTNTGAASASLTFVSFFDAEIDETTNTFFNEYAETDGTPASGQSWEIDEPGYVSGDIYDNAQAGALDGTNAVGIGAPDDVSMALGFAIASLAPGQTARFEFLLSEDGDALGGFFLRQRDIDPLSTTAITYSGVASIVPEPGTALLVAAGAAGLAAFARRERV